VRDERGTIPGPDFSVGGACVKEFAGEGEGGDVGGVALERCEAVVEGGSGGGGRVEGWN